MTRPERLIIAGQKYEVRWIDDRSAALSRHADRESVGHSDNNAGFLAIRTNTDEASPTQQRDTLLHEVLHAVVELTYLGKDMKDQERVISTVATHLLDTLRRNPGLAEYLTE